MIETERLILRDWEERDRAPFAALNADPEVMATLGPLMSRSESDALVDELIRRRGVDGFTFTVAERKDDGVFLGFVGLTRANAGQSFDGMPEIGWRLNRASWGNGYATEAAEGWLDWVWRNLEDPAVVAITSTGNVRSRAVMERIGMTRDPALDFNHPRVPDGSALKAHVTYRIERPENMTGS